jgi:hypothetical protein
MIFSLQIDKSGQMRNFKIGIDEMQRCRKQKSANPLEADSPF